MGGSHSTSFLSGLILGDLHTLSRSHLTDENVEAKRSLFGIIELRRAVGVCEAPQPIVISTPGCSSGRSDAYRH